MNLTLYYLHHAKTTTDRFLFESLQIASCQNVCVRDVKCELNGEPYLVVTTQKAGLERALVWPLLF